MDASLGLATGSAAWKDGHDAVRSRALDVTTLDETHLRERVDVYAAERARVYMAHVVAAHQLTPAEGVRLFGMYMRIFVRGALDQALDNGALMGNSRP